MVATAEDIFVLVIDDLEDNLRTELDLLKAFGIDAVGTQRADEVPALLDARQPTVVLTDINLRNRPGDRSGVELARSVSSTYPDLPIVGYSSSVFDLGAGEKRVFAEVVSRGDDTPERLVAASIRHSLAGALPRSNYPLAGLGLQSIPAASYSGDPTEAGQPGFEARDLLGAGQEAASVKLILAPTSYRCQLIEPVAVDAFELEQRVELMVVGHPELGGTGPDLDTAVADLLAAMRVVLDDLRHDADSSLGRSAIALRSFLRTVLAA